KGIENPTAFILSHRGHFQPPAVGTPMLGCEPSVAERTLAPKPRYLRVTLAREVGHRPSLVVVLFRSRAEACQQSPEFVACFGMGVVLSLQLGTQVDNRVDRSTMLNCPGSDDRHADQTERECVAQRESAEIPGERIEG